MTEYYIQDNLIEKYKITNVELLYSISSDFYICREFITRNKSPPSTIRFKKIDCWRIENERKK